MRDDLTGRVFTSLTVIAYSGIRRRRSHWRCLCICGREVFVDGSKLRNGHTRSCGCIKKGAPNLRKRKPYGEALRNRVIWQYKANAKSRGVVFDLELETIVALFASDCFYCGRPPSMTISRTNHWGEFTYTGIDRVDNELGYSDGNVVPCCMECNYKKGAQPQDEFLRWVQMVASHQNGSSYGTLHTISNTRERGLPLEVIRL